MALSLAPVAFSLLCSVAIRASSDSLEAPVITSIDALCGQTTVNWVSIEGATAYAIWRGSIAGLCTDTVIVGETNETSWTDIDPPTGEYLCYRVQAIGDRALGSSVSRGSPRPPDPP
jgi:hypothetical protein